MTELKDQAVVRHLSPAGKIRKFGISRFAAAASIAALLVFTGIRFNISRERNKEYARSGTEDRFKYSYDIDESLVEDELVSHDDDDSVRVLKQSASPSTGDEYLLEHSDVNTLIEEI